MKHHQIKAESKVKVSIAEVITVFAICCIIGTILAGCDTLKTDVAKAQSFLNSDQGKTAAALVDSAANIAITAFGGKNAAKEGAALQGVDLFAGTLKTGTAPTTGQIAQVLTGLGVPGSTTNIVAPAARGAIDIAISSGLTPTQATVAGNQLVQSAGASISAAGNP